MLQSPFIASLPIAELAANSPGRFHNARQDFIELLSAGCYRTLDRPAYYLLEITGPLGTTSYGICGLIDTLDYGGSDGKIRPHEATLKAREARQRESFLASTHFIKPILLTCPSYPDLRHEMIDHCRVEKPTLTFTSGEGDYLRLFVIHGAEACAHWTSLLAESPAPVAVADGHHRISTARQLATEPATAHRFARVPAVLIPADSLVIDSYLCSVTDPQLNHEEVFDDLRSFFWIERVQQAHRPVIPGHWLLARAGAFYEMKVKQSDSRPGTAWFDESVLPAVFNITDSTRDPRWLATPAGRGVAVIEELAGVQPDAWHFLPPPVDMNVFFRYLEEGKIFPPKSTRFLPRIPSGLIVKSLIGNVKSNR